MKKLYPIAGLALMALVAASCHQEVEVDIPEPVQDPVEDGFKVLTLEASGGVETKTTYANDKVFSWNVGDEISVLCNDGTDNLWQTFTATTAAATSSFTATVPSNVNMGPVGGGQKLAMYPAAAHVYENAWTIRYTIPAVREFREAQGGHRESAIPMFAWGKDNDSYAFANLTGAAKFTFSNVSASHVRFVFTSAGVKMNGSYDLFWDGGIDPDNASNVQWNAAEAANDAEKTVTFYADVENGAVSFYVPYATGEIWAGSKIRLEDADNDDLLFEHNSLKVINIVKNRISVFPTMDVAPANPGFSYNSAYGVDWTVPQVSENEDNTYPAIKSLRADADDDYLYLLMEVDPTQMETNHSFAHRLNLYAGDWSTGFGAQSWAISNSAPAYLNWESGNYSDCTPNTTDANSWFYEIRLSRTHSTTSSALAYGGTVNIGVKMDNRICDDNGGGEVWGYANGASSTTTIGRIPSSGLYPVTLPGTPAPQVSINQAYTQSSDDIANPERGLYKMVEYKYHKRTYNEDNASKDELTTTEYTSTTSSISDNYYENSRLVMTLFYLFDYVNSDSIDSDGVNYVRSVLTNVRNQGKKAIVRFAYNNRHPSKWDMEPTVSQIETHLGNLAQTLSDFEDVIYVVQAGFIGTYGEWYYTTNFGPSSGGVDYSVSSSGVVTGFSNRERVLDALLNAVPASRQIELRTPEYKQCYLSPGNYSDWTELGGFGTDPVHRLAFHNDAFLYGGSNGGDMGTFSKEWQKNMWKQQGEYLINGGEAPYSSTSITQMAGYTYDNVIAGIYDYHYSYLHHDTGYHSDGGGSTLMYWWHQQGWMNDIVKWLGYRLYLTQATITGDGLESGSTLNVSLTLENSGAARVVNERPMKLVLLHNGTPTVLKENVGDVRLVPSGTLSGTTVTPGSLSYTFTANLSQNIVSGDQLALWLPDQDPQNQGLQSRSVYSIRLANNETTWTEGGYNVFYTF